MIIEVMMISDEGNALLFILSSDVKCEMLQTVHHYQVWF